MNKLGRRLLPLTALLLLSLGMTAGGAEKPLDVRLVSETTAIQPGRPFYVGLLLHHGKGHHSYWKFPGIVGVPTSIQWDLPEGFSAGEIEWPEPQRVLMFQIKAQGFKRDVLLPVKITPPTVLKQGEMINLRGRAAWMSCANICNPGFTDIRLQLPVSSAASTDPQWRTMFERERACQPRRTDAWSAQVSERNGLITLTLSPVSQLARRHDKTTADKIIFFTEDGWIDSDQPQQIDLRPDGALIITLRKSDYYLGKHLPSHLVGIIQAGQGWLMEGVLRSLQVNTPIHRDH